MESVLTASLVPSIADLLPARNGEGLILEGMASTPTLDRQNDVVNPQALAESVKSFMATNPVLMFAHKYGLPPIGRVLETKITDAGLWIKAVMPRPEPETFASEVWNAARDGLLRAFSLGARWTRVPRGDHNEIVKADMREISLCPISVGFDTVASSVVPTEAKCLGSEWLTLAEYEQRERDAQDWLLRKRAERELDRIGIRLSVAEMLLA